MDLHGVCPAGEGVTDRCKARAGKAQGRGEKPPVQKAMVNNANLDDSTEKTHDLTTPENPNAK
jgi:hypothetical protein